VQNESTIVDLVLRARDGDNAAWQELVRRYAPLVWAIGRQFRLETADIEDVGQTVWLSLVEWLPRLREPAALPGWLATTTRRECVRVVEAARKRGTRQLPDDTPQTESDLTERRVLAAELDAALRDAFAQLGAHCQQLLVLLMQTPRLPYSEISARLDMPVGSIGPSRARCLARLRRCPVLAAWIEDEGGGA
jgi:RNA polymerase sigma factor (sigma-70 family)